ncbi:hypothetical protein R1flu_006020 [Riccia fluitans]|uniref:Uncharacterized protein n=1 Tax=Riccia fluitans TaxID=41844 RepID=A0ABD1YUT9_9MARC
MKQGLANGHSYTSGGRTRQFSVVQRPEDADVGDSGGKCISLDCMLHQSMKSEDEVDAVCLDEFLLSSLSPAERRSVVGHPSWGTRGLHIPHRRWGYGAPIDNSNLELIGNTAADLNE